jgi:predicted ABC-type sugar transport system permease subunit
VAGAFAKCGGVLERSIDVAVTCCQAGFCGLLDCFEDVVFGGTVASIVGGFGTIQQMLGREDNFFSYYGEGCTAQHGC